MIHLSVLSLAMAAALTAVPALAQDRPAASASDAAASMPRDCDKTATPRHHRGADRNVGVNAGAMPCAGAAASAPRAGARKTHHHAKFDTNQ